MIDLNKFVGNELSISATADLETPSKKMLLEISCKDGMEWAESNSVDFNYVNKAVIAAMKYAMSFYSEEEQEKRNHYIEETRLFGFLAGVIDYTNKMD